MAKPTFTKLGLKKLNNVKTIQFNDNEIEVKQYLPVENKLKIITSVLENSADDNNFANPVKVEVFFNLELIFGYTNITFTEKQKENMSKLYDLLEENGVIAAVVEAIPETEYNLLFDWTQETIDAFYSYRNSVLGILEAASADYSNLELDAEKLQKQIADPKNLTLLKDVMEKLG
mgnify:CR=1 FL=1